MKALCQQVNTKKYKNDGFIKATKLREPSAEESFFGLVQKGDL